MESFAVLGLAASILQFLDFSGKLISGTLELYQAVDGATSSNLVLENISKDPVQLCAGLLQPYIVAMDWQSRSRKLPSCS